MVNHFRTLLLNMPRDGRDGTTPGEQFIPADFVPRACTGRLQQARTAIFGPRPDRLTGNYRTYQCLQLVHASVLQNLLWFYDARTTYSMPDNSLRTLPEIMPILRETGSPSRIFVAGDPPFDSSGRCSYTWTCRLTTSTEITATCGDRTEVLPLTFSGSLAAVTLPQSDLKMQLSDDGEVGGRWRVDSHAKPSGGLPEMWSRLLTIVGHGGCRQLLADTPRTDCLDTVYELWQRATDDMSRLAAVLFAVVERTAQSPPRE